MLPWFQKRVIVVGPKHTVKGRQNAGTTKKPMVESCNWFNRTSLSSSSAFSINRCRFVKCASSRIIAQSPSGCAEKGGTMGPGVKTY